jgi:predicted transcriptional regulator
MTLHEILTTLNAQLLTPEADLDIEVHTACGSDMMSDVLAYVKDQAVLLTGLNNPQVIRTADMMDMHCVVFVRGKQPDEQILKLADMRSIAVLTTELTMFAACGLLYAAGLRGGTHHE